MVRNLYYRNHKIHVNLEGAGQPILLLHGWPANANLWKAQRDFLKRHYLVISPDWLGFGQSDKPTDHHYSLSSMTEILDTLVAELVPAGKKLSIIAHDIGGPASLLWTYENQDKVNRLIMLNTLFYNFQTPLDKLGHFFFNLPLLSRIQLSDFGLSSLVVNLLKNKKEENLEAAREVLKSHENWAYALRRKTILEPLDEQAGELVNQLAGYFKKAAVEKHLLIARKDPLCYAHMQRIHEDNPEVPAHFLENCGHFIPLDRPEELNGLLEEILAKTTKEEQI
jgi:pimeloyl-ACP methyl ester carboxylesterase